MREAITTSALLKLPRSMSTAEKVARVDGILKELVSWGAVSCRSLQQARLRLLGAR